MDKADLRKDLLLKLAALPHDHLRELHTGLTNQLVKLFHSLPELSSQIGAAYLPFKTEVAPLYQELLREVPLNISFPVLEEGEMKFGIPHGLPKGSTWLDHPYSLVEPEWLLVPGLGFDLNGSRLGRGKGHYDRYLETHPALCIGVCWSGQLVEKIPMESHDSPMDYIITESFCFDVSGQNKF